jgi:hypothetical protein
MDNPKVVLPWMALNQVMAIYEEQVPPNPPVEYSQEPSSDEELPAAVQGSIAIDDLRRVLVVVTPLWDATPMSNWALHEAIKAIGEEPSE